MKRRRRSPIDDFATVAEAAVALGVSVTTVHRLRKNNTLPCEKILGRVLFDRKKLEALAKTFKR